jgi:biopolymer transport protein ExbD
MKTRTRRLFQKKAVPADPQIPLQITSMADVFTILLVFLLKSSASDALAVSTSSETRLPEAAQALPLREDALQVELSRTGVLVNKEFVAAWPGFEKALNDRLSRERVRQNRIAESNRALRIDHRAILLTDVSIPFSRLKSAMRVLSQNGYSSIHFGAITP